jgi:hypothetical protein
LSWVLAAKKKSAKKKSRSSKSTAKGPLNLGEVRDRVRRVIAEKAEKMTNANAEEASKGYLPQLKYLFEVLGLYPATAAEEPEAAESNDLARVLLRRFNFPFQGPADEEPGDPSKEAPVAAPVGDDSVE